VELLLAEKPTEYSAVDAVARVSALYAAQKKALIVHIAGDTGGASPEKFSKSESVAVETVSTA
jgi:hypothetical protein